MATFESAKSASCSYSDSLIVRILVVIWDDSVDKRETSGSFSELTSIELPDEHMQCSGKALRVPGDIEPPEQDV